MRCLGQSDRTRDRTLALTQVHSLASHMILHPSPGVTWEVPGVTPTKIKEEKKSRCLCVKRDSSLGWSVCLACNKFHPWNQMTLRAWPDVYLSITTYNPQTNKTPKIWGALDQNNGPISHIGKARYKQILRFSRWEPRVVFAFWVSGINLRDSQREDKCSTAQLYPCLGQFSLWLQYFPSAQKL